MSALRAVLRGASNRSSPFPNLSRSKSGKENAIRAKTSEIDADETQLPREDRFQDRGMFLERAHVLSRDPVGQLIWRRFATKKGKLRGGY